MIDYLRHVAIFSAVARNGSFSEAARSLGIAPSRVSESVSKLEHYVGATLFNRTTRKITLTSEGRRLFAHTSDLLEGAERGLIELRGTKAAPMGSLRISIPSYLSSSTLTQAVGRFVAQHAQVHVTAEFTDHDVEPVRDDYDMCVRSGQFNRQRMSTRKLGRFERGLFVGKGYLANQKAPDHPKELAGWDWINYRHAKRSFEMKSPGGDTTKLSIQDQARLQVDNIDALYAFASMDLGVAMMPVEFAKAASKQGELVRLFDDWRLPQVQYSAIWPDKSHRASLISLFVEFLTESLQQTAK